LRWTACEYLASCSSAVIVDPGLNAIPEEPGETGMKNPYLSQPTSAFWARAVSRVSRVDFDPVVEPKFQIEASAKVATAGSCFAQHIANHMRKIGLTPMITEWPHAEFVGSAEDFHYGVYTARYGNIYTARQMLQLFQRAFGQFTPVDVTWRDKAGAYVDPFRPLIPEGFASQPELDHDRARHLAAVRAMFREANVIVFTLGLTESWRSRLDGAVFPSCPGTAAGTWDPERYEFVNFGVSDIVADLEKFRELLATVNPDCRIILTVSPVPLVATATDQHVVVATTYSKSALRVAAEEFARGKDNVDYFPSYEMVTGPQARGQAFEDDCRSVRSDQVALVMRVFARHYLGVEGERPAVAEPEAPPAGKSMAQQTGEALDVICDEIYNDVEAAG
jgi:hypothetical protein